MPIFSYRVRSKEGTLIRGISEAIDIDTVAKNLHELSYSVVSIEEQSKWKDYYQSFWQKLRGIKYQEVIFLTRQLSALLSAGVPLDSALGSLEKQVKNQQFQKMIKEIITDIHSGISFSEALSKHPQVFNQMYVSMVKVAEAAGMLDTILERLAEMGFRTLEIRTRVRSALVYPVILVFLSICVVSYLLASVVPRFVVIFSTYGIKLPLATHLLINLSLIVRYAWFVIIAALIFGVFSLRRYLKSSQGRYNIDLFILKIPLIGEFLLKINLVQFSRTLSVLIKSGVPILEALSVTQRTIQNAVINKVIQDIHIGISEGKSIVEPFVVSGIFPPMVIQMVSAGEKTGQLEKMLSEVAYFYDQEIEYAIRNISSILEPVLLLIMGFMVAFIALAILSPIFNLIKVFRH